MSSIDNDALEEFNLKADLVQRQVDALLKGTLNPDDVKMPGEDSWAYASAKSRQSEREIEKRNTEESERVKSRLLQRKWDSERAERLAGEERERWWKFARMQYGDDGAASAQVEAVDASAAASVRPARGASLAIDYSWWDKWAVDPDDPVTREEERRVAAEKESAEMKAFEEANAGFCMSFKKDQLEREHADRLKAARADLLKNRGNTAFGAKDWAAALAAYHDALRLTPFNAAIINNIAASHLALNDWVSAKEFASRTIFIEPKSSSAAVKARFRRAHAVRELGELQSACEDLVVAAEADPANADVERELRTVRMEIVERAKEAAARVAPAAALGVAPDGLPSKEAISEAISLADMDVTSTIHRTVARFERIAHLRSSSNGEAASADALRNELRSLSRELRAAAARLTSDESRVLVRTSGLLNFVVSELRAVATALLAAVAGGASAPGTPCVGALAHMAVTASCVLLLSASCDNLKNRVNVRGDRLTSSGLGAILDIFSFLDSHAASGWITAYGLEVGTTDFDAAKLALSEHLPQLMSYCVVLFEAFARPMDGDPEGRVMLVAHSLFRPSTTRFRGTLAQRLSDFVAILGRFGPGRLPSGTLEAITGCATVFQQLCIVPPSKSTGEVKKADPNAHLHDIVSRAVENLAGDESSDITSAINNPISPLLSGITSIIGRALLDGESLLWSPVMNALTAAVANLAQKEKLRAALLAPMTPSPGASAATSPAGSPMPPALRPLIDLLRIPIPDPIPKDWDNVRASILAALSNVCINSPDAAEVIAGTGAVTVALSMLSANLPSAVRGRTAMLLGRLATTRAASEALSKNPAASKQVIALLAKSCAPPMAGMPDWASATMAESEGMFQDGLLRLLAGAGEAVSSSLANGESVKAVVAAFKAAVATLSPQPRAKIPIRPRVVGAGNACKVVILIAAHQDTHIEFFNAGACDVLVDALKYPGPQSEAASTLVRKNAASAIARLMKNAECADRLRSLRAMEVIVTLNRENAL
jgi:tetratricopeptide (TPR) repeat protein